MNTENYIYVNVSGAGKLEISKSSHYKCGGKTGFSFGVEWGKHGFAGGVIDTKDAIMLAEHILKTCDIKKLRKHKLLALKKPL